MPECQQTLRSEKIAYLEETVRLATGNMINALERIAPLKTKNLKTIEEPWRNNNIIKEKMKEEQRLWNLLRNDPDNHIKREE